MSEEEIKTEFIPKLENAVKNLFEIFSKFNLYSTLPPREMSYALMKEADEVETFLDEFGANQNRRFFLFRELIAAIRWFNFLLFQGLHLYARVKYYKLDMVGEEQNEFKKKLKKYLTYAFKTIKRIGEKLKEECENTGIRIIKGDLSEEKLFPEVQRRILPPDLGEEIVKEKEERIFEILIKYMTTCEEFNFFVCYRKEEFLREDSIEKFRSLFGQLESLYDTYIKKTKHEMEVSEFEKIRGHIAISLHLLEMAKAMAHFYERHIEKIYGSDIYYKLIECIGDQRKIEEIVKNFVLPYVLKFSQKGKEICEVIFSKVGKKPDEFLIETKILIVPSHRLEDFHIRPVMPITQIANKYNLDTFLYFNRKKYDVKSPIEMAIAIPDIREALNKENVKIVFQGPSACLKEISEFLREKVGAVEEKIKCEISIS